jgi:hypothetical protein
MENGPGAVSTRIVAPNVDKLSPASVVEVRLQAPNSSSSNGVEVVAILCSVDVLKMRSSYFHEVLMGTEPSTDSGWRDPLIITDASPHEAATFLEVMHDCITQSKDWNFAWARLSVTWGIEDYIW